MAAVQKKVCVMRASEDGCLQPLWFTSCSASGSLPAPGFHSRCWTHCCECCPCDAQVSEVKNIMVDNIEKVLERGEKIELLVDKTDNLRFQASARFTPRKTLTSRLVPPLQKT